MLERRPAPHEIAVGDENARRVLVRAQNANGLARLNQQRFVVLERFERVDDAVECGPVAGCLA
jgi:hypothetical protein